MSRVVKAYVHDDSHLITDSNESIIVDDDFHMTKKGWWFWELIGTNPPYTIRRVIYAE